MTINGMTYEANFVQIAVNVIRLPGTDANVLPEIVRGWFGPDAGERGTDFRVGIPRSGSEWSLEPRGARRTGRSGGALRPRDVPDDELLEAPAGLAGTHDPGEAGAGDEEFWAAVRRLPRRQAQAVVLYCGDDMPTDEVAGVMRCAEGTVRALLHQARTGLAKVLDMEEQS